MRVLNVKAKKVYTISLGDYQPIENDPELGIIKKNDLVKLIF